MAQIFKHMANSDLTKVKKCSMDTLLECFDSEGRTPLGVGCINHQMDMIVVLLQKGLDPNYLDKNGKAPLHYAANLGYEDIAQLLVNKGAQLNIMCRYDKNTVLHYAVMNNCISMVKYIVELLGPCPQLTHENNSGKTPLRIATDKQFDTVANMLKRVTEGRRETVFRPTSSIYEDLDATTMDSLQQQIANLEHENRSLKNQLEQENRLIKSQLDAVKKDMSIYEEKSHRIYSQYKVIMRTKDIAPPRPPKSHGGTPSPRMAQPEMKYFSEGAIHTNTSTYVNHHFVSRDESFDEGYLTPSTSQTALAAENNTQQYMQFAAPLENNNNTEEFNGEDSLTESETDHVISNYQQLLETIKLDRAMKAELFSKKMISATYMKKESYEIIEHMILEKVLNSKAHFESLKQVLAKYGQNDAMQLLG